MIAGGARVKSSMEARILENQHTKGEMTCSDFYAL